jgi:hypothetical protein
VDNFVQKPPPWCREAASVLHGDSPVTFSAEKSPLKSMTCTVKSGFLPSFIQAVDGIALLWMNPATPTGADPRRN